MWEGADVLKCTWFNLLLLKQRNLFAILKMKFKKAWPKLFLIPVLSYIVNCSGMYEGYECNMAEATNLFPEHENLRA